MALTQREEEAQPRLDFAAFAQRCFRELNPLVPLAMNWHFEVIAAKLAAACAGEIRRLILNVPPRYLKSLLGSVASPAWSLGRQPGTQIVGASYVQDLADKLARDRRHIIISDWYQLAFSTRLSPQRQAVPEFETTQQGCRLAASVGEVLTGRGADLIIIDDPLKPEEALSQAHRQLAQEPWEIVRFPSIAEEDETWAVETVWGPRHFTRRRGEALHPEREALGMLEQIRRTIGEYNFAGQYQRAPSPLGGGLVKQAWLRRYAPGELPQSFDRVVQSWDTANKATELSPHPNPPPHAGEGMGGGARAGGSRPRTSLYLLDVLRRRMEYPELKRAVREQHDRFRPPPGRRQAQLREDAPGSYVKLRAED